MARPSHLSVLVSTTLTSSGGGITHLREVLPRFARRTHVRWTFLGSRTLRDTLGDALHGFDVHTAAGETYGGRLREELFGVPSLAKAVGAHVVFAPLGLYSPGLMSRLVWMPRNVGPYSERVITAYGHGMRARLRVLRRLHVFAARHAACTLCVSEHSRTTLAQLARLPANTLALAPHGVTQQAAPSADQTRAVLNTCGIDRPFLLSVAHGYVYKNIVELVHAYALIREQRPDLLLVLAGGWPEADYRRRVDRAIAMHRSICHDIRLIGSRSAAELLALNHAAEVAVATSWLENCPNTLLEHMACGCAIVCSNEPPMPEHARDGATLVDVDDPRAIADAVLRLLGDASLKANLREKAKRRSADFSWDATEERTFDAICRVARQNGADVRE